jgi:hypothetical protein
MVPELSVKVKSWRSGEGTHCGRMKKDLPLHGVANSRHHSRSSMKAEERESTWWSEEVVVLWLIILLRKLGPPWRKSEGADEGE